MIKSRIVVHQSGDDADSDDIDVVLKPITFEERLCYYYVLRPKGRPGFAHCCGFRSSTLFAPLNCLPLLKICFSSFSPLSSYFLFLSFFSYFSTSFLFALFSAVTLFVLLNCLTLLRFCFSSFSLFFPLISLLISFFSIRVATSGIFPPHFFPLFFSAVTLFAPLNCLPILIFCFSSFPLFFPLILSFFLEVCESYPPFWNIGASASSFYFLVLFNSDLSLLVLYCRQRQMWCGGFWLQLSPLALLWFPMRHSTPKPTSLYTIARLLINGMKLFLDLVLCFCAFLFWAVQEIRWSFAFATYILGLLYL